MATYPALDGPAPVVWTKDHIALAEDALRQLAIVDHVLRQCENCKMEVGQTRAECDSACEWVQNFLARNKGQQSDVVPPLGG